METAHNRHRYSILIVLLAFAACSTRVNEQNSIPGNARSRTPMVTSEHLFAVESWGSNDAWIAGFEKIIMHTPDGGQSWETQQSPILADLYDICFVDTDSGWIVGQRGTILHTSNSGATWTQQKSNTDQRLFDAHFIDVKTGWAVGTMGSILHTSDGGKKWIKQGWNEDRYYNGVYFIDAQRGWIVGEYSVIYHTEDGGTTWSPQVCNEIQPGEVEKDFPPPPPNLYGVYFKSPLVGWATGMDGIIIKTGDGGKTWKRLTPKTDFTLYQVAVVGEKGWAIGAQGSYMVSSDGGNTWKLFEAALGTKFWLRDMAFSSGENGWIVGARGTILYTDNAGDEWKKISGIYFN
jgi:photosystem II stability/assembly factor-like uncharacterized protein